ncbi:MAG: SBBP repeat-containing protein [Acidobacteriia bacterium]|nr:SBBP repeat-containing protein [Terriglobia bacterium]
MPRTRAFILLLFSVFFINYAESQLSREPLQQDPSQARTAAAHLYKSVPISFEANQGQADHEVRYLSRGAGYSLFLSPGRAELAVRESATVQPQKQQAMLVQPHGGPIAVRHITIQLLGANPNAVITGLDELPGKSNYLIGNDPEKWRTGIAHFARVTYRQLYPGVDMVYYGHGGELESDFIVAAGADPKKIRLAIQNAAQTQVDWRGNLVLGAGQNIEVRLRKPVAYQTTGGTRREIPVRYRLVGKGKVTLVVGAYDRNLPLVIDPVLSYSTYLGGSNLDNGTAIAVDSSGSAYVTGGTPFGAFPSTPGAFQVTGAGFDVFITKFDPTGTILVYSTFLGGSLDETAFGIAVDASGNAYVTGQTTSTDFPLKNPVQATCGCGLNTITGERRTEAFISKINSTGSALIYSTYLGGSGNDAAGANALDSAGNAYVAGATTSPDFNTINPLQVSLVGTVNAFVTKINAAGSAFTYSTYLGGSGFDFANGIAVDSSGNAYVAGVTNSLNFPTTTGALQTTFGGVGKGNAGDGFLAKIDAAGSSLAYSTYLGGSDDDSVNAVTVDASGNAYVTGATSSANFVTTTGAFQTTLAPGTCTGFDPGGNAFQFSCPDAFVVKLNAAGSAPIYATLLGGTTEDSGNGIALDSSGNVFVAGFARSADFPLLFPIQAGPGLNALGSAQHAFVSELNAAGSALFYSTYLGGQGAETAVGIALDSAGNAYVAGVTNSPNFPAVHAFQPVPQGSNDAFVAKIDGATAGPALQFKPLTLTFAAQLLGTTSPSQNIILSNPGNGAMSIAGISITGPFTQTNDCGATIAPAGSCTIQASYVPAATGDQAGFVNVSDSAAGSPHSVFLSGTLLFPGGELSLGGVNFPEEPIGVTSAAIPLILTSSGNAPLHISNITTPPGFAQSNDCGSTLAPGAFCTINVTSTPLATGSFFGNLAVNDDAPSSPQTAILTGFGVVTILGISPSALNFGTQLIGNSTVQDVTLSNAGGTSFNISNIAINGVEFTQTNTCPAVLGPSASCIVHVTFSPAGFIGPGATLNITDTAGGSPHSIALKGIGSTFLLHLAAGAPNSITVNAGQTATFNLLVDSSNQRDILSFTCTATIPQGGCGVSPPQTNLPSAGPVPITVTVNSAARATAVSIPQNRISLPPQVLAITLLMWCVGLILLQLAKWGRLQPAWRGRAWAFTVLPVLILFASCGGGGSANVTQPPPLAGTPAGSYTVTVIGNASSNNPAQTVQLFVRIN